MGDLVDGDDGLPAEMVGPWVKDKHRYLCQYIDISRAVRRRFIDPGKAGATYVDLFCGPGRCQVKTTGEWLDGGAVAAWKQSVAGGAAFSSIYIGDSDLERREACVTRLRRLGAPVVEVRGEALDSVDTVIASLDKYGLHLVFLDPYNLQNLDFQIVEKFSLLRRIDLLVHISAMDLQRNLSEYIRGKQNACDLFAPGWRQHVDPVGKQGRVRSDVMRYWRNSVANLGVWPSESVKLLTGTKNQPLYWLLLAAKSDTALRFWKAAAGSDAQGSLI